MATFNDFSEELKQHRASNKWVTGDSNPNDIYWKLLYSSTGNSKKIANYPDTAEIRSNLQKVSQIIVALAKSSGFKIYINSGYRNKALNTVIGGSTSSQHMKGQAVDMDCGGMSTIDKAKLFLFIVNNEAWKNKFDQIIWEKDGSWVHCSFKCNGAVNNDASYSPRPYTDPNKVLWMTKSGKYNPIWNGKHKRTTTEGYVFFENVPGLTGIKYDGKSFDVDYSKISDVNDYQLSGNDGGGSYGKELTTNYGGSNSYAANRVTNLSKARNRKKGSDPNVSENRKNDFSSLADRLIEETPPLDRNITKSQEMYGAEILKGDQISKKRIRKK